MNAAPHHISALLLAGPTASGKSALAIALADAFDGIIINADSMQAYRELSILTARPGADDLARAPHRLYGHVPAGESYSTGKWLAAAAAEIEKARAANRLPIVVGGTGLYFAGLEAGLSEIPGVPESIREGWRARFEEEGAAALHRELCARDPEMAARIEPGDSQRIVRALEVHDATGKSMAHWQAAGGRPVPLAGLAVDRLVLAPPRDRLYARINARLERMVGEGALDEVAALHALALPPGLPAMKALGVRPFIAHLEGAMALDEAVARTATDTRRYAKRQLTWARGRMGHWRWLDEADPAMAIAMLGDRA